MKNILIFIWLSFFSWSVQAYDTLPSHQIPLNTSSGETLLSSSNAKTNFWPLLAQLTTQNTLTYCGIASSVTALNALAVPGPEDSVYKPYRYFTQEDFFSPAVTRVLPATQVAKQGATLDQLATALATYPVKVTTWHADQINVALFRKILANTLKTPDKVILVNFLRTGVGETGGGHFSVLAAYNAQQDRVLLLDVARYRYPPLWIRVTDLWQAIDTVDKGSEKYRGLVMVEKD